MVQPSSTTVNTTSFAVTLLCSPPQTAVCSADSGSSGKGQIWAGQSSPQPLAPGCLSLITLRVSLNLFEGGTGCHEWEAGFFLAEWVMNHPALFQGEPCCAR